MISLGYFMTEFVLSSESTSHAFMVVRGLLITITQRPGSGAAQLPGLRSYVYLGSILCWSTSMLTCLGQEECLTSNRCWQELTLLTRLHLPIVGMSLKSSVGTFISSILRSWAFSQPGIGIHSMYWGASRRRGYWKGGDIRGRRDDCRAWMPWNLRGDSKKKVTV